MQSANLVNRHRTCVVSFDVAVSLQLFRSGLSVPSLHDPIFERLHQGLLERVTQALRDIVIYPIDKNNLRLRIWEQVQSRRHRHAVVVTCSEMSDPNLGDEGLNLSINRLFDSDGKMLGYGPRPGFDHLGKQFDDLARRIAGRPVILAKEGAFRGNTCLFIFKELENRGVQVATIIFGFCDEEAKSAIKQAFSGELVTVHLFEDLAEWIADRDLIPFVPGCGRVVGERDAHSFAPVRTSDDFSCAYPYILPFGKIEKWASLPALNALELSVFALDLAIELFERISRDNGHQIAIGELLRDNPRVSMPVKIGVGGGVPALNTGVVGFLREMRKSVK